MVIRGWRGEGWVVVEEGIAGINGDEKKNKEKMSFYFQQKDNNKV